MIINNYLLNKYIIIVIVINLLYYCHHYYPHPHPHNQSQIYNGHLVLGHIWHHAQVKSCITFYFTSLLRISHESFSLQMCIKMAVKHKHLTFVY